MLFALLVLCTLSEDNFGKSWPRLGCNSVTVVMKSKWEPVSYFRKQLWTCEKVYIGISEIVHGRSNIPKQHKFTHVRACIGKSDLSLNLAFALDHGL